MVLLSIGKGILDVAKSLIGVSDKLKAAKQDRKDRIATLFEKVSDCLAAVSSEIRSGKVPHGRCAELEAYGDQLPDLVRNQVPDRADALGNQLKAAHNVEGMAQALSVGQDKEPYLAQIEEASGKFHALSNIMRAS